MDQDLYNEGGDGGDEDPNNHPILRELKQRNNYNPTEIELYPDQARFFVIKSYSEDDIHRSIKYEIWCSTEHGNKRLDQAFRERQALPNGSVYLFFSVNGSGHFCGTARMMSPVDYDSTSSVWAQDKWKGQFKVRWIYVKDVPNNQLRHITLENNENKPVTNSRDTQEVPVERGKQVLVVMHQFKHSTSIFDDFLHYEKKQEAEVTKRQPNNYHPKGKRGGHHHQGGGQGHPHNQHHQQGHHNQYQQGHHNQHRQENQQHYQSQQSQQNQHHQHNQHRQENQQHYQSQHNQHHQHSQHNQHRQENQQHYQSQHNQHHQHSQHNQQHHSSYGEDYHGNSGHAMPSSAKINQY